jgi:hypothetical protein
MSPDTHEKIIISIILVGVVLVLAAAILMPEIPCSGP